MRPFHVYSPDINPAIEAEFAHAVYRFGHSMLDDDVARVNTAADGTRTDNSLPLLKAFLNPPEFFHNGGSSYTPEQAAGAIVMGSADQVGNELDEFVTETLRNNLLGLPLDLPAINMTRAREAGVPRLNDVRRQIHDETNDGAMQPYTDWSDFGQHLKHPESLINFVAAYGTHPTITSATTLADKRAAARAIVDPLPTDLIPPDAGDFMFGTDGTSADCPTDCNWSNVAGKTTTGLDDVDLWVGGLAEVTNVFGGLLGSTFNYVFQTQLEKLQDGDRLYYLNRTPGMNLRTQLEGNSFSELIERNTDGTNTMKADAFATADCKFQLGAITFPALATNPANSATPILGAGSVNNDPNTECDENLLLLRKPDGTFQYRAINRVDPSGINGQSVYNGSGTTDRVFGGNDNDTFLGNAGADILEGNGGDDFTIGGDGNDIETDLSGADVLKGGPGNDALDGGIGDDIFMGGDGQDFINGGANDNESFAGPGNDFIIAGQGADAVFGDGGDDWIEGGSGQDLLQGDHGAPFFDDPAETAPGNDVFVGQVGENDYDTEGGDDLMAQNAAVDRNAGSGGFDWAYHQYDTVGANDDMEINNNLVGVPIQIVVNRDRWQETEADSGSAFNDVILGTEDAPNTVGGAGFTGCNVLDQAGVDRIAHLSDIMAPLTESAAPVIAASAAGSCPISGPVFGAGNILLGGAGSDTITGRGADDIIDGDRALSTRISVRTNPADPATEIGTTDLMENKAIGTGNFGANTAGMNLQQAVFAGLTDPGNLVIVRELVSNPTVGDVDTAVFRGARAGYTLVGNPNGSVTISDAAAANLDGTDTLWNVERAQFTDQTVSLGATATPTPASLTFTARAIGSPSPIQTVTFRNTGIQQLIVSNVALTGADAGSYSITSNSCNVPRATNQTCAVGVRFTPVAPIGAKTAALEVKFNAPTSTVVNLTGTATGAAPTAPGVPGTPVATLVGSNVSLTWPAPASDGNSPITRYNIRVITGINTVQSTRTSTGSGTTFLVTGLTAATAYHFTVSATNAIGTSLFSASSNTVTTPATAPAAATPLLAVSGAAGGAVTFSGLWLLPAANSGGSPRTQTQVFLQQYTTVAGTTPVGAPILAPGIGLNTTNATFTVPAGFYRYYVVVTNAQGSTQSANSGVATAR